MFLGQIWGTLALWLANADLLAFDFDVQARHLRAFVADLEKATEESRIDGFEAARKPLSEAARHALDSGGLAPGVADRVNRGILEVERHRLDPEGLPVRPWFRHTLYAACFTYAHLELPGVTEAAEAGDWDRAPGRPPSSTARPPATPPSSHPRPAESPAAFIAA